MHSYLTKHAFYKEPLITDVSAPDLKIIVVIPAFKEENITSVLDSLALCDRTKSSVETIIVINHAAGASQDVVDMNMKLYNDAVAWSERNNQPHFKVHVLHQPDLPKKKAGVGLARKIGMDEAVQRFRQVNNPSGIILCLDADCTVEKNYLLEVEKFFSGNPKIEGCSIEFEHKVDGFSDEHMKAIMDYENHLWYFIAMQRWAGCPFAFQTIGSTMAVRADVYCKVGGMNMRQAGEDFYFLHKVIARGAFAELNATKVYPSPRISDRVPFGTGRAMMNVLEKGEALTTYHPQSFVDLKAFLDLVPALYGMDGNLWNFLKEKEISECVVQFLQQNGFDEKLIELQKNTSSLATFKKRFFHWFDAFLLMKFVHYARNGWYENVEVREAMRSLASLKANPGLVV